MTLGDIIKKYRDDNSVTMDYVASLCGITKGYVAMLERNINSKTGKPVKPTIETIIKVCNGLKLDVDKVFSLLDDDYVITFSAASSSLELDEKHLLDIYRTLNSDGQEKVITYATDLSSSGRYTVSDNSFQYNAVAAHERTDIEVTDKMRQFDDDIMNDEDF